MYVRAVPDKVTVEPSDADKLLAVNVVPVCTLLAGVPLSAVIPPMVGLKIKTDFMYASDVEAKPKIAVLPPV